MPFTGGAIALGECRAGVCNIRDWRKRERQRDWTRCAVGLERALPQGSIEQTGKEKESATTTGVRLTGRRGCPSEATQAQAAPAPPPQSPLLPTLRAELKTERMW